METNENNDKKEFKVGYFLGSLLAYSFIFSAILIILAITAKIVLFILHL